MEKVQERAERLLGDAKAAYEEARAQSSREKFIDAGFRLEDARIKFLVLQEAGTPAQQALAADRLKLVNQLSKLIHDGKVATEAKPGAASPAGPVGRPTTPPASAALPATPAATPSAPQAPVRKLPLPDAGALQRAERQIKDVFREEYARKIPAERANLAREFATLAVGTEDDPAARFVLLRESADLASGSGEIEAALETLELLGRSFEYDAGPSRTALYAAAARSAVRPEDCLKYAQLFLKLADEALAEERLEAADKAASEGLQMAKKAKNLSLVTRLDVRAKEIAERKSAQEVLRKAKETLAQNPRDPESNRILGEHECFIRGNWERGLDYLSRGSDVILQDAAKRDLARPATWADQIALGDAWWDLAEKKEDSVRTGIRRRADYWYEKGESQATGILRLRVTQRRKTLRESDVSQQVDLLKLIDLKRDVVSGQWIFDGPALLCQQELAAARVQIPYLAPDEYDVILDAERVGGAEAINIGLTAKGTRFHMVVDGYATQGYASGLALIDGQFANQNETTHKGPLLANFRASTIVCSVRATGLRMRVDDTLVFEWTGDFGRLSNYKVLDTPNPRTLYLSGWGSKYRFSRMTLVPITGKGEVIRD
jgi:hypothetical protein